MQIHGPEAEAEAPVLWPPDVKSCLTGKDPDVGKHWEQEGKGTTEDQMVGWHHWFNEQILGDGEGQGSPVCCSPWGYKESDRTWQLNSKAHLFNHQTIHGLLLDVPQTPLGLFLWQALPGHLQAPLPPQINADTLLAENKRMNFLISTYSFGGTIMPTCQFKYQREKRAYKKRGRELLCNWD